ncbi:unnamed protein product, partial [Prorocentrum cordatum]
MPFITFSDVAVFEFDVILLFAILALHVDLELFWTWAETLNSKFHLRSALQVLEKSVEPAHLTGLASADCAVCDLRAQLVGSDAQLGKAEGDFFCYAGEGMTINETDLIASAPLSAAPGVQLIPPALSSGDTRFLKVQKDGRAFCDGGKSGPRELREGTWEGDWIRNYPAENREIACNEGHNCRWFCLWCRQRHLEESGVEVPRGNVAEKLAACQK